MSPNKNRRVCSINSYRLWLYSCNVLLLAVVCAFAAVAWIALHEPRMMLIPLNHNEPLVLLVYIAPLLQVVDVLLCFCGLWRNRIRLVFVYWAFLLILLVSDFVLAVLWVFRWRALHKNVSNYISTLLAENYNNGRLCRIWDAVQVEYSCCGVTGYRDWRSVPRWCDQPLGNGTLPKSCCDNAEYSSICNFTIFSSTADGDDIVTKQRAPIGDGCFDDVLQWMHNRGGNFLLIGFCFVIFTKIVLLIILRAEIREFTYEVDAARHRRTICADRAFSVDRSPYIDEDSVPLRRSTEKISTTTV